MLDSSNWLLSSLSIGSGVDNNGGGADEVRDGDDDGDAAGAGDGDDR